ncbi:23S rRNA (adenine(2503)-C(2))-methyltransferase RlmN [Leadbettera azotonutricia]|uniref:Radical SAM enzyme, Cfr family n=1 Tax=Leadbettera azotonutricia (strain ATCC BAA-888 / DSM 13862 / ZAS-9) TaxID=545695 RepID=F5YAZ2_LEAAZ|nr:23S rRNA (adenine(2503)-C(2))-methyltransferase RlmN [Leadbettera azotonutricia]AEF80624.1 radical SAM enzyme, Cfr family [Leadbettera azotonutricia ZAS-9]
MARPALAGLSLKEICGLLPHLPGFRHKQICQWICAGVETFEGMNNLPKALRDELNQNYRLYDGKTSNCLEDEDGTVKLQITLEDNSKIEAVILSDGEGRKTACISTQAGCPAGCLFCKTGSLGFTRNLTSTEMVSQFLFLRQKSSGTPAGPGGQGSSPGISHIVIMGMGEPLLNLEELRKAIAFFCDEGGLNISKRRITLSTSGIAKGIQDLAANGPDIRLALSLTTARQDLRKRLMPFSDPLPDLKEALVHYQKNQNRRITLEAVLLGGLNTSQSDAAALAGFARGLDAVVNLIPWNPVEGLFFEGKPLAPPLPGKVRTFARALETLGLNVTLRYEKGRGVNGACGQLGELRRSPA